MRLILHSNFVLVWPPLLDMLEKTLPFLKVRVILTFYSKVVKYNFFSVRFFGLLSSSLLFFHNLSATVSSSLPQVSSVYLGGEMILINSQTLKMIFQGESFLCPGCRIHQLHLNECPGYDTKYSPSLPSLPGLLWPGVAAPGRVLSMGKIELNCILILN